MQHLRIVLSILLALAVIVPLPAQKKLEKQLQEDLSPYFEQYHLPGYTHFGTYKLNKVRIDTRSKRLGIYPNDPFFSQPFTPKSVARIYKDVHDSLPEEYKEYRISIYAKDGKFRKKIEDLIPNQLRKDPSPARTWRKTNYQGNPWVRRLSAAHVASNGLTGRHVMINASHGRYYKLGKWRWQRPYLFCTTEDLLTHSFVYPFLIPMMENAGAVVYTARERDHQVHESVVDNDPTTFFPIYPADTLPGATVMAPTELLAPRDGSYQEIGQEGFRWDTAPGKGFATPKNRHWLRLLSQRAEGDTAVNPCDTLFAMMHDSIRPFSAGTVRMVPTVEEGHLLSQAIWTPNIPEEGAYAVYVSYATLPNSVSDARYKVYHKGGCTEFQVNQRMGSGTWVYLGTFNFDKGENFSGRVTLTNQSRQKGVVTADAVRFGGGIGQTARDTLGTSGMPRFLEGARYYAQWSGIPDSLFIQGDGTNDYNDDIRSRSVMANYVAGGSAYVPGAKGLGVPIEMCVNIHSDAGVRKDSIYGSMAICMTKKKDGTTHYPAGILRDASWDLGSRALADVQRDLSKTYGIEWFHRELWDRSYGEARSPNMPAIIFETLSHQNFTDMKYAHDPNFKFTLARALYKTLARHINYLHNAPPPSIQPLAPQHFAALVSEDGKQVRLSWMPTPDPLEPTALPTGYIVYTRQGNGDFDNGQLIGNTTAATVAITPGQRYDFKVTAVNSGGESFPSEVLSVFHASDHAPHILIVNGFQRLSGPARIERADSLGFDIDSDLGVPYRWTASFAGRQEGFDTLRIGKEGPGALGYCTKELEGKIIGGNTFDYPVLHGAAIASSGRYSYSSISKAAWLKGEANLTRYAAIDYIAGAEKDAPHNLKRYKTFCPVTRDMLTGYLTGGGKLFVSGSYIASDMKTAKERHFINYILKYRYAGSSAADSTQYLQGLNLRMPFLRGLHAECYPVQAPDAILPASPEAFSSFIYGGGQGAGIAYPGKDYRVIATGFPFEAIGDAAIRAQAMDAILRFLTE